MPHHPTLGKPPEEYDEMEMCKLFGCRPSELDEEDSRVILYYELHKVKMEMLKQQQ